MASYQYRVSGVARWMSNSGNAIIALSNNAGSGKKLVIQSIECCPQTSTGASAIAPTPSFLTLARCTVAGGTAVPVVANDTGASAWPSTVRVLTQAATSSIFQVARVAIAKQLVQSTLAWMSRPAPTGFSALHNQRRRRGGYNNTQSHTVRAGEAIALIATTFSASMPVRVSARIRRSGTPDRTHSVMFFTQLIADNVAVLAIDNAAGSGETVTLEEVSIEEVGTYDSPYLMIVPVGSIDTDVTADATRTMDVLKMDTASPTPTAFKVRTDAAILPFGMPENALADSSTGSPKGFNYLKTKDFLGPVIRAIFPEITLHKSGGLPDAFNVGIGHRASDLGFRRARKGGSQYVLREGESLAIVSAAETAAGATVAVGLSGWSSFEFAITLSVEPKLTPTLSITGLRNPSEIRVFRGGTTTEVAGQENVTSGTFSWVFDPDDVSSVDIAVLSLGYQNIRLTSIALALADVTIPVQQQIDRQYLNP